MSRKLVLVATALLVLLALACGVKKEKISVGQRYEDAKELSRDEILAQFQELFSRHQSVLIKKASMTFSGESLIRMKREKLPTVSGVLALRRNGDLRLQVFAPLIKTTMADVAAREGLFEIWFPKKKTLYKGKIGDDLLKVPLNETNDGVESDAEPRQNLAKLRPWHITTTFFHSPLGVNPSDFVVIEEDSPQERYYVLHEIGRTEGGYPVLRQKIWLERSTLNIRKKFIYNEEGVTISQVIYWYPPTTSGRSFPQEIFLYRPIEGYRIQFRLDRVDADAELNDEMFHMTVPESAKIVELSQENSR
ncbi:MAG: hypothetical protein JXQ27_02650 [Acidobacteria bacterium]|nr:hypothetical protein [Acidobacteriota bacterium]